MSAAVKIDSTTPPHAPRSFSTGAIEQLSLALHGSLAASSPETITHLKDALTRMCLEAHERGRGLKPMLAAVRRAWPAMPHAKKRARDQEQIALDRVLRQCLEAYYAG